MTLLGGAVVFTGTPESVIGYKSLSVHVGSDVSGTVTVEFAAQDADFATPSKVNPVSRPYSATGQAQEFAFVPLAARARVKYTNGPTPQTVFVLQTILRDSALGPILAPLNGVLTDVSLASTTRTDLPA